MATINMHMKLKFQSKLELCSRNHVVYRQTDGQGESSIPPLQLRWAGVQGESSIPPLQLRWAGV